MSLRRLPTRDALAFSSFVQGEALFRSYLGSGLGHDLQRARDRFAMAAARDPEFHLASIYLATADTELRDSDAAIAILKPLVEKTSRYRAEASVQLAYAYVKRYRDADYAMADNWLAKAGEAAREQKRPDLMAPIQAYRLYVHAVRGGRSHEPDPQKLGHLNGAIAEGQVLLSTLTRRDKRSGVENAAVFETHNGLGIAFMWRGWLFPEAATKDDWMEAEKHYNEARALRPNSVRVLQNLGTLNALQGDRAKGDERRLHYERAREFYQRSIDLNSFDRFPHYGLALILAKLGNWEEAEKEITAGLHEKGAVSDDKFKALADAVRGRDSTALDKLER